ncbi:MAG TPA: circadian clock protein KaiC [Burkholderiales bacterium]|nr:circadian clock protein KaiC [Burkholderiales bacterium]
MGKSEPASRARARNSLPKTPTGISGLDEITLGGLPKGRPTLVCGSAGCGKTLFAMEFLLRGAQDFGENGVFIAFEETEKDLSENVRSLGLDLNRLVAQEKIAVDYIHIEPQEIAETGDYDLEGLFLRLGMAIDAVGAKRIVIDTIETLFGGFTNQGLLRAEIRRLFRWLKDRGVTAIITGERGDGQLTRQGLEEYVSDCVILLDHRVHDQVSTRRLRIVKYRGTTHGTNEYPFLIDEDGISVLPVTEMGLDHAASTERISSGVPRLDAMLGGQGYYRGSSILVSGTAGSGKTSLAAHFANATCERGERCLYLAFEESRAQLARNMKSIGLDLERWIKKGLLRFEASRPQLYGLEMHLAHIHKLVKELDPAVVIIDPVSNFTSSGTRNDSEAMLMRLIDFLKARGTTAMLVNLTSGGEATEKTEVGISSIIDTWLLVRDIELGGERNRGMYILKSRGMKHSNQIREFVITPEGIDLLDVYVGPEGVLTGSMRAAQEAKEAALGITRRQESERKERELQLRRTALEAQIAALRAEFDAVEQEAAIARTQNELRERLVTEDRAAAAVRRGADAVPLPRKGKGK